jgi:hypothetical protein
MDSKKRAIAMMILGRKPLQGGGDDMPGGDEGADDSEGAGDELEAAMGDLASALAEKDPPAMAAAFRAALDAAS